MTPVVERVVNAFRRPFARGTPWYRDLCDYYGVTPEQALALGTRQTGRRPDLPGSATTHPVSGQTFEAIWSSRLRETPADIRNLNIINIANGRCVTLDHVIVV